MRIVIVLIAIAAVAGATFIYSGSADVAATSPHWSVTAWVLSTAMQQAVERRAADIEPPSFLDEEARVRSGANAYQDMCATCHGAPGVEPGVVAAGLNPPPPELAKEAETWSAAELFWITKHGIRMTGMPAFGPTHSEEELWELVALVRRLPRLSPAEYGGLVTVNATGESGQAPTNQTGHEHEHSH